MSIQPQLDALIVRNLEDIEQSYSRASKAITETLAREINALFEQFQDRVESEIGDLSGDPWFALPEWKSSGDEDKNYDLFFWLTYEGDEANTWPTIFVGANGASAWWKMGSSAWTGARTWKNFLKNPKHEDLHNELRSDGFIIDEKEGTLRLPLRLKQEVLAHAFETENFDEALEPVRNTLQSISTRRDGLDRLVALIRSNAVVEPHGPAA
jgi:hypothetical protein